MSAYDDLIGRCDGLPPLRTAVVHPVQSSVFETVNEAAGQNLIEPVLIGPAARINTALADAGHADGEFEVIDVEHSHAAAETAARMAAAGEVDAIMKGSLHSDELLEAVVDRAAGLRTACLLYTSPSPRD